MIAIQALPHNTKYFILLFILKISQMLLAFSDEKTELLT